MSPETFFADYSYCLGSRVTQIHMKQYNSRSSKHNHLFSLVSSPGTNVLGEVLSYPRRQRRRRCRRRQFQVKVFVLLIKSQVKVSVY